MGQVYGLSFPDIPFRQLFAPLWPVMDQMYWSLDFQTGPFVWNWDVDQAEETWVELVQGRVFWKPGAMSVIEPHFIKNFDEWSYLAGFLPDALAAATHFDHEPEKLIEMPGIISITYIDTWWEVYTQQKEWLDGLHAAHPSVWVDVRNFCENRFHVLRRDA